MSASGARCEICAGRMVPLRRLPRRRLLVGRCERCALVCLLDTPSAAELAELYSSDERYQRYLSARRVDGLEDRYAETLRRLTGLLPAPAASRPRLYDVGAGSGAFLSRARQHGFEVAGNDVSRSAIQVCERETGIRLTHGDLALEPGRDRHHAITLWCVLAHVADPRALLADVHRLLAPGGVLYLHTPRWCLFDTVGLAACRLSGDRLSQVLERRITPAHRRLYNRANLSRLLLAAGFELLEVRPRAGLSLTTGRYLRSLRVPPPLHRPLGVLLEPLIRRELTPRNLLEVYARKPMA